MPLTAEDFAARLTGRAYPFRLTHAEIVEAKVAGLVVVYGASDDLVEFEGAVNDERGCYEGGTFRFTPTGPMVDWDTLERDDEAEVEAYFVKKHGPGADITANWSPAEPACSWTYTTSIPHSTFDVLEDGELYCRGIVFALSSLSSAA